MADWLAHLIQGTVTRYDLPGIHAFNFVCESALGGGGMTTLRNDALGKGMAQMLLEMPVHVPVHCLASGDASSAGQATSTQLAVQR